MKKKLVTAMILLASPAAVADGAVRTLRFGDFVRSEVRVTRGEEFPGGRMEVAYPADESVKLDFDFRKGGRYVGVFLPEIGEGAICLSGDFRVSCEVPCGTLFSARDAKGDSYCALIKPERAGEWSPFAVPLTKLCWCGGKSTNEADRAHVKWPLRSVRISCEPKKPGHAGSFEMCRLRLKTMASDGFDRWAFSLKPPRFGSLYLPDETIVLPYRIHRLDESADAVMPMRIERAEVTDRLGRQVHVRTLQEECGEFRLQAGDLGNAFGSFKVAFFGRSADGKSVGLGHTWFARLTGRSRPVAWCGTGMHGWGREQLKCYDLMETVGIGTVRNEPIWALCERQKGVYTVPELFGAHLDALRCRGMSLNMILNYGNTLYEDPVDVTAFCRWARHLVTHEARDVKVFEVWNEAWNTEFGKLYGKAGDDTFFGKFVSFSQQVADMLHEVRPEATVAVAAEDTIHGLTNMLARNIARPCDAVSFHPYVHRRDPRPERLDFFFADDGAFLRKFAAEHGGARRFRISEVGWTTYTVDEKGRSKQSFGGYPGVTLAEQADYLVRACLLARSFGVESTMQYDFRDDGPNRHYTEHNFGLVFGDCTPKPSLAAIAFMTRTLGNAAPLGEFGKDRSTHRLLGFEGPDGRRRYVGWAIEAATEVALPEASEPLRAHDLTGNPLPWDGRGRFRLTESPVYFFSDERKM